MFPPRRHAPRRPLPSAHAAANRQRSCGFIRLPPLPSLPLPHAARRRLSPHDVHPVRLQLVLDLRAVERQVRIRELTIRGKMCRGCCLPFRSFSFRDNSERIVLLDCSDDRSSNCCSALLFCLVRLLAGTDAVFSVPNACVCGEREEQVVALIQKGRENNNGYLNSKLTWFLIRAVAFYGVLERSKQWQRVLAAYLCYALFECPMLALAAFGVLAAVGCHRMFKGNWETPLNILMCLVAVVVVGGPLAVLGWVLAAWKSGLELGLPSWLQCFGLPALIYYQQPGPPRITNQVAHVLMSHVSAALLGLSVFVLTMLSQAAAGNRVMLLQSNTHYNQNHCHHKA